MATQSKFSLIALTVKAIDFPDLDDKELKTIQKKIKNYHLRNKRNLKKNSQRLKTKND